MRLGNYEWDPEADLIAEGAFAEVFRARDTNTASRTVALKIYKEAVAKGTSGSSGQKKYTLEKEFQKVDGLSHTNIITYYGLDYIRRDPGAGRPKGGTYSDKGGAGDHIRRGSSADVRRQLSMFLHRFGSLFPTRWKWKAVPLRWVTRQSNAVAWSGY